MLILNETDMWKAVTLNEVMDGIEEAYAIHKAGNYKMPDRMVAERGGDMMLYMPCFLDSVIGTKMLAEFPGNPKKGYPYLSGLMLLNDADNGSTKAILNGGVLTAMRTGANGGVGMRYLSAPDCTSVGLVGCGVQGLHQLMYACEVRPIEDIYLFDAYAKDLTPFMNNLKQRLKRSVRIHACSTIYELLEGSQICISATQSVDPVYPDDEKLLRGKCFIAVGSWQPQKREIPDAVLKLVRHIYTEMPYACEESGDLRIPLERGTIAMENIKYMEDLIADTKSGAPHEHNETTFFKSVGMGIFDAKVAELVYLNAQKRNIGQQIEW